MLYTGRLTCQVASLAIHVTNYQEYALSQQGKCDVNAADRNELTASANIREGSCVQWRRGLEIHTQHAE